MLTGGLPARRGLEHHLVKLLPFTDGDLEAQLTRGSPRPPDSWFSAVFIPPGISLQEALDSYRDVTFVKVALIFLALLPT